MVLLPCKGIDLIHNWLDRYGGDIALRYMKALADNAYIKGNCKALKKINREIDTIWKDMEKEDKEELKGLLKNEIGEDVDEINRLKKINNIKKRGVIRNKKEYELILNEVEFIYKDDSMRDEIILLNTLLSKYK
ncbi:MAG: hypothetical protein N4A71_11090 [Carboxylicivirga sp.]|jgi:hypothetical protein|nr:hypothetical protein [Carboxylicivirga sp.]